MWEVEELIRCAQSYDVCVEIDDLPEVLLAPEGNLCEGEAEVETMQADEVLDVWGTDPVDGNDVVEEGLGVMSIN